MPTTKQGFPLSTQQARLWSLQGEHQAYQVHCALRIEGPMDLAAFFQAVQGTMDRQSILRTSFQQQPGMDLPMQIIHSQVQVPWVVIDAETLPPQTQELLVESCFGLLQRDAFDLSQCPLLRLRFFSFSPTTHVVFLSLPALCADETTLLLLATQVSQLYTLALRGERWEDEQEESLRYVDVAAWQDEVVHAEKAHLLDGSHLASQRLPFEREERALEKSTHGIFVSVHTRAIPVPDVLLRQMQMQAQLFGVPVSSWMLACWQVLLWRLSDDPLLTLGVACDGRTDEELAHAFGLLTRFVPLTIERRDEESFSQVLARVQESLERVEDDPLSFTWDEGEIASGAAFFSLCFEYENWPETIGSETLTFSLAQRWSWSEPFALKVSVVQIGERLHCDLYADPQRISAAQVHQLATLFATLLQGVVAQPYGLVSTLPLLTAEEDASLVQLGSAETRPLPNKGFHQLFEDQARRFPNQMAVISVQERLTYQQVNEQANRLAQVLRQRGVGPNVLVGLAMTRCWSGCSLFSKLGVLICLWTW